MTPTLGQMLPSFHVLTGCDTTSCFVRQGKLKPWKLLEKHTEHFSQLADMGILAFDETINAIDMYVASIYNGFPTDATCNELRYKLFASKGLQNEALPPTRDALEQHVHRAEYQVKIWLASLSPTPTLALPEGKGWSKNEDGRLQPILSTQPPMPQAALEFVRCHCSASMCLGRCSCKSAELPCTNECPC